MIQAFLLKNEAEIIINLLLGKLSSNSKDHGQTTVSWKT